MQAGGAFHGEANRARVCFHHSSPESSSLTCFRSAVAVGAGLGSKSATWATRVSRLACAPDTTYAAACSLRQEREKKVNHVTCDAEVVPNRKLHVAAVVDAPSRWLLVNAWFGCILRGRATVLAATPSQPGSSVRAPTVFDLTLEPEGSPHSRARFLREQEVVVMPRRTQRPHAEAERR